MHLPGLQGGHIGERNFGSASVVPPTPGVANLTVCSWSALVAPNLCSQPQPIAASKPPLAAVACAATRPPPRCWPSTPTSPRRPSEPNLSTLVFIHKYGVVRRRTTADSWPPVPPLRTVRGAFRNGDDDIRVALPVTSELLRGSGHALHKAAAAAAGVSPGQPRTFPGPHGEVTLSWNLSSTHGTNLGSLRVLAGAVDATLGDTLVVAPRPRDGSVGVTRIGPDDDGLARPRPPSAQPNRRAGGIAAVPSGRRRQGRRSPYAASRCLTVPKASTHGSSSAAASGVVECRP